MTSWFQSPLARRGVLLLCAAVLTGCAAVPISTARKLTGDEGAVVLKFITNSRAESDPAETLSTITLERERAPTAASASAELFTLVRTRSVTHTTAVFSGMVPPGRYTVVNAVGGVGNTTYTFPIGSMMGKFEVKKGEVSLLGTMLVQPLEGSRFNVGYVPPDAELSETFEQLFPALAEQTRGKPVNSFESTADLTRRAALGPLIKQLARPVNGLMQTDKGEFYAGGKLGKVSWRPAGERRWQHGDVGGWREVMSLRPYRGGLLAAGEEGLLRHSSDNGKTWVSLTPPDRGLILTAEPLANGKVVALVRRDEQWTAYVSDDVLAGAWRKLGSFADERSYNVPGQKAVPLVMGHELGLMMPTGEMQVVDSNTGNVDRRSTGLSLFNARAYPDGLLVMQGAIMLRKTLVSTDSGKTWVDLEIHRGISHVAFADRKKAYALGPLAGEWVLMLSLDGGRTWAKAGGTPTGANLGEVRELVVDRADGSLLAFMQGGRVLRSSDQGKTWGRES